MWQCYTNDNRSPSGISVSCGANSQATLQIGYKGLYLEPFELLVFPPKHQSLRRMACSCGWHWFPITRIFSAVLQLLRPCV